MLKVYKFILLFMCILFQNPAFAVNACVPDDSVVVVLNSQRYTNDYVSIKDSLTWQGSYGNVRGIIACLSSTHDTPQWTAYKNNILIDNGAIVVGGEQNVNPITNYSYCWCKTTYPIVSRWVLRRRDGDSLEDCVSWCATHCQYSYKMNDYYEYTTFRANLFKHVN